MKMRPILSTLMVGFLALTPALKGQELYFGDDEDMSPEEYYLEGIGYGSDDYSSGSVEDSSYSGLYTPSAESGEDSIYGGYDYSSSASTSAPEGNGYALPSSDSLGVPTDDAGDWFSMSGVTLLEAVGEGDNKVLITRDLEGKIEILQAGDTKEGAFKILAIGDEQARVEPVQGGRPKVVPILHRSAPLDSLLMASARLQSLRLVIAANAEQDTTYDPSMLDIEKGFAPTLASKNLFLKRFDDVVVVRSAPFVNGEGAYQPQEQGEGELVSLDGFRSRGDEVLDKLASSFESGLKKLPGDLPSTTIRLGNAPAREALHYLNLAYNSQMEPKAPKASVAQKPASKGKVSKQRLAKAYAKASRMYKAGEFKKAGKLLYKICKAGSKNPIHFQALGKCYYKLGNYKRAALTFKRSYSLKPHPSTKKLYATAKRAYRKARQS